MVRLFCYGPAWTVPCISPFVTKVAYYLNLAGIDYEMLPMDPYSLYYQTPYGKLPVIEDDDGTVVADSTSIIQYLERTRGNPLDGKMSARERAQALAFNRLLDEHFYWAAVIQPRWREQLHWETYAPIFGGKVDPAPELRDAMESFRRTIMDEFDGQGMGRLGNTEVYARARQDVDALSDQLGDRPFLLGQRLYTIDANVLSFLKHTLEAPFDFDIKRYIATKENLVAYAARLTRLVEDGAALRQRRYNARGSGVRG